MRFVNVLVIVCFAWLAGACSSETGPMGSCRFSSEICYDLLDGFSDPGAFCASVGGPFSEAACPTALRVGRCTVSGTDDVSGDFITSRANYYEPRTTEEVRTGCIGTFEPN